MAISYSAKFKKMNLSGKVLIEKEGEVVFDRKYLRLKGKGANDHGLIVNFTDIKEVRADKDALVFNTFSKEIFEICRFSGSFENFLEDFYRIKNDFFAENLFMKEGMLLKEYDCGIEITNSFGKSLNIGKTRIQFYEQSMVFIPKTSDVFMVNLNFMKHHHFDEDMYQLQIETDSGTKIFVSKLGSYFDEAKETLEGC